MPEFYYRNGRLMAEDVSLESIAERIGTPTYIYSRRALENNFLAYREALQRDQDKQHLVCYAVKANSNLGVLSVLAKLGSGFDIVSVGELERVLLAGGDPTKVVFSGVAKSREEIRRALEVGVHCFNVESETELQRIDAVAAACGVIAPISIRVNPDVDAQTHPYIATGLKENKFGIDIDQAPRVYRRAQSLENIRTIGIDCHIGSQLTDDGVLLEGLRLYRGERFKDRRYFKNSYKIQFSSYDQKSSELERSRRAGFKKIVKKILSVFKILFWNIFVFFDLANNYFLGKLRTFSEIPLLGSIFTN